MTNLKGRLVLNPRVPARMGADAKSTELPKPGHGSRGHRDKLDGVDSQAVAHQVPSARTLWGGEARSRA